MGIQILTPGVFTTVQDLGRLGYQAYGVSPAGALDRRSAALANVLVGNPENEGLLEITLGGTAMLLDQDNVVAVCGAPIPFSLDGTPQAPYRAISIRAGQKLCFQYTVRGVRAYLAFAGGLDIPLVMGSRSTHVKSGVGGFRGRQLKAGDRIDFRRPCASLRGQELRRAAPEQFPMAGEHTEIRLLPGPQDDYFTAAGLDTLFHSDYQISADSDRMGYRLRGSCIERSITADCITDGVVFGSVQVPPSGQPIVMMADRQTTGGYPKIATVITEDLPVLAQCPPGTFIRFVPTTVERAQQLCLERREQLRQLRQRLDCSTGASTYKVQVNGKTYFVAVAPAN